MNLHNGAESIESLILGDYATPPQPIIDNKCESLSIRFRIEGSFCNWIAKNLTVSFAAWR
jgi:hypothetical protein